MIPRLNGIKIRLNAMELKLKRFTAVLTVTLLIVATPVRSLSEADPSGYVVYCPCMGRFGNQADHFLGALAFSKGIDRTLILPHWVEYRTGETKSIQVPFDEYMAVEPLLKYHRVITMNDFMKRFGKSVWPEKNRISFCYVPRGNRNETSKSCNAKEGNPFGPFWDTFNINFVQSEFYSPMNYDIHRGDMNKRWKDKYPPNEWPVLAFTGAPASFPVQDDNKDLHKYLHWNKKMTQRAEEYIENNLKGGYIGIHLRNGPDWARACQHVPQSPNLFSSPQCVGYRNEFGPVSHAMCMPSKHDIIRQLKRQLKATKDIKNIFVASDNNHMIEDLQEALKRHGISIKRLNINDPHLDLAILGLGNHFIGNCVSSFTAFVKRERDARGFPSTFWAFPTEKSQSRRSSHEEL